MTALPRLEVDAFDAFYQAVHDFRPFPWQTRLAHQIASGASWPNWLALPTASGKTSAIDIAVFALAVQAERPAAARTAPRRIFFVVDRRVIVDQAAEHAQKLADALANALATKDGVLSAVASRLRWLADDASRDTCPLDVFQLRGGIYRDDAWVRSPLQPAVIASTVDQVGSRLLFRGYGLRGGALWPIHAGLVANDALVILDEAHCSNPFRQTLEAVSRYRRQAEQPLDLPFHYSVMSATPPAEASDVFGLDDSDRDHEVLRRRLRVSKRTRLVPGPKARGAKGERQFADALAREAVALRCDGRNAIAVIVNRVRTAKLVRRAIEAEWFAAAHREAPLGAIVQVAPVSIALLTGRTRPVDADSIRQALAPLRTGNRNTEEWPARFVVATQTLEVGADLDFDGLVTECASLDALRQRFGRLNRSGRDIDARGVVVIRGEYAEVMKDEDADPIYGGALTRTWKWLTSAADAADAADEVDFGVEALQRVRNDRPADGLDAELPDAPVVLPAHIDRWAQTSPPPWPDPDVALFLHGPVQNVADVQVCWRSDLPVVLADNEQAAVDTVGLCPPTSRECMPVPLRVFRQWLEGKEQFDDVADIDPLGPERDDDDPQKSESETRIAQTRWCVRWRGIESSRDASTIVRAETANSLVPGETVVLSASLGGWEEFGHVEKAPDQGGDYGDETNAVQRRRAILRLTPAQIETWGAPETRALARACVEQLAAQGESVDVRTDETLERLLLAIESDTDEPTWRKLVARTIRLRPRARTLTPYPANTGASSEPSLSGWVVSTRNRISIDVLRALQRDRTTVFTDEDDAAVATIEVPLRSHLAGVARWASRFASAVGLPEHLVADIETAASLHDVGKVDRRFQAMLRGGNRWLARSGEPLAKSGGVPRSVAERRRIRQECGYPDAGRHELLSVRLVEGASALLAERARDRDLVLHLIASHHGACRPFAPVVIDSLEDRPSMDADRLVGYRLNDDVALEADAVTGLERLDSGVAERFWILNRRYGWWGLAFLEGLLRLADWCRSEEEQDLEGRTGGEEAA